MFWNLRILLERIVDRALFAMGRSTQGLPQLVLHQLKIKLPSRNHILLLVCGCRLRGLAVEVGVFEADYSLKILEHTQLTKLYSIDPWQEFAFGEYIDLANDRQEIQDRRYLLSKEKLGQFANRSEIIRLTSEAATGQFADCSLDFIYIDANHSYEGCLHDLQLWWPKLKKGGIIAGDDFTDHDNGITNYGVRRAVQEFFQGKDLRTTYKSGLVHWPNWYIVKD